MTDADVKYETRTVRAMRGTQSRTVAKWEADGWQLVSQTPGTLQTQMTFRRTKLKSRRLLWVVGGGAVAIVLAMTIIFGVIGEQNAAVRESPSASPSGPISTPSESASAQPSTGPEKIALTPENNAEFAALLAITDYCDPSVEAFAAAYSGQTIEFPGHIGAMAPHDGATTRYDILLGAGDFSETSSPGPAFQLRDVNTTSDLDFTGSKPETIGVGTNLVITAEVGEFEVSSCLFLLEPISAAVR